MSETLRDLVVSLSLQTDNFTRNIKSVNKQIQEAESRFRLAAAGVEGFERTTEGLTSRLTTLDRRLSLHKDAVAQYERALSAANDKLTECYHRQNDYAQRLEAAKAAQIALKEQVASSADDIAEVVAIAGQLGIETDYLTNFARTMIDLGNSTDIVADKAASTLAKFANITGMAQSQFGNLGAALVDLGNNYATTESAIMNMAMRLAAAGDQVGLSKRRFSALQRRSPLSSLGSRSVMISTRPFMRSSKGQTICWTAFWSWTKRSAWTMSPRIKCSSSRTT